MGVIPIPRHQTLFVGFIPRGGGGEVPSLEELGRLWYSGLKGKEKKMAFEIVKISELPVREFGRKATEPRVGFAGNGRFVFNKLVSDSWGEKIDRLIVQYDPTARVLRFTPVNKGVMVKGIGEKDYLKAVIGGKGNGVSAGGAGILTKISYDFKAAGNQVFDAKLQSGKDGKGLAYDVVVPKETPAARPVVKRAKKAAGVVAATAPNGAVASAPVQAPAESELSMELEA